MITPSPFTAYLISGVWSDHAGVVSHYAVHQFLNPGVSCCKKYSKKELLELMGMTTKPFYVFGWDYKTGGFKQGQKVVKMEGFSESLIWTEKQEPHTKNLKHLIKVDWFEIEKPR